MCNKKPPEEISGGFLLLVIKTITQNTIGYKTEKIKNRRNIY